MTDELSNRNLINANKPTTADLAGSPEQAERAIERPSNIAEAETRQQPHDQAGVVIGAAATRATQEDLGPLFSGDEANNLRVRWDTVQAGFVDQPRESVENADRLITATMDRLEEIFASERQKLELQWDRGESVSTEDLRLALRRYRSFFSRLLNV